VVLRGLVPGGIGGLVHRAFRLGEGFGEVLEVDRAVFGLRCRAKGGFRCQHPADAGDGVVGQDAVGDPGKDVRAGGKPGGIGGIETDDKGRGGRVGVLPLPAQKLRAEEEKHLFVRVALERLGCGIWRQGRRRRGSPSASPTSPAG
jgi:hypothetical protein